MRGQYSLLAERLNSLWRVLEKFMIIILTLEYDLSPKRLGIYYYTWGENSHASSQQYKKRILVVGNQEHGSKNRHISMGIDNNLVNSEVEFGNTMTVNNCLASRIFRLIIR